MTRFRPPSGWYVIALVGVVLLIGGWATWTYLPNQVVVDSKFTNSSADAAAGEEKRLKALNDARTAGVQLLGLAALAAGGILTWRTIRVTRQGQLTQAYGTAIAQLGEADKPDVQLGGIYTLERIARESPHDHWPVMQIVTSFLRRSAAVTDHPEAAMPSAATQAIAMVLSRRRAGRESTDQTVDMGGVNLSNVVFNRACLRRANLAGSLLSGARLERSDLREAQLGGATLRSTHLDGTDFRGADLRRADFTGAYIAGAKFKDAKLDLASFYEAHGAQKAQGLPTANIEQSKLREPSSQ
jgi:hypothetical protein